MSIRVTTIVDRMAEAMPAIDMDAPGTAKPNRLRSAFNMSERQWVQAFADWWRRSYPQETPGFQSSDVEHPYPGDGRRRCDLVIRHSESITDYDWAIEAKKLALVGDNGKNNDFPLQKLLSPYLKDRSLLHDASRLLSAPLGRQKAIIVIGFDFPTGALDKAFKVTESLGIGSDRVHNLQKVLSTVDQKLNAYTIDPALKIADYVLRVQGLVKDPPCIARFDGLTSHPCGTHGIVCGWKLSDSMNSRELP